VLIASGGRDAPGTLALWDETTGTLIAGSLVSIDRVPDLRDVDGKGWPEGFGLVELPARCDVPEFATWDGYAALHVQNANRAYLRMERDSFSD
jgi:hypothetical protein